MLCCILPTYSYDNQLLMEYKVKCGDNELAFFNVTDIDIEGNETCNDREGHPRYLHMYVNTCTLNFILLT